MEKPDKNEKTIKKNRGKNFPQKNGKKIQQKKE